MDVRFLRNIFYTMRFGEYLLHVHAAMLLMLQVLLLLIPRKWTITGHGAWRSKERQLLWRPYGRMLPLMGWEHHRIGWHRRSAKVNATTVR